MKSRPVSRGWLRSAACLAVAALAVALAPNPVAAQANPNPPERMTYQGFLVDGNGVALGNTAPKNYDVIFRIYNHETQAAPANLLWAEQQTVTVDKGYFSVLLGEGAASDGKPANQKLSDAFKGADASDRFVGITVLGIGANGANVDILPRLRMLTSPYAYLANQAIKVVRTDNGADLLTASGNVVSVSGSVNANSFTGSGTGLTGVAKLNGGNDFNGTQRISSGHLSVANASTFYADNFAGASQPFLWPRWTDNIMYLNYGEGGFHIRNHQSASRMFMKQDGNIGIHNTNPERTLDINGTVGIWGGNALEFGRGVTKQVDAGKIGYGTFIANSLNIVGGGTTASNRRLDIWNEGGAFFTGPVSVGGLGVTANRFLARGGYPGSGGVNGNGYAFSGNGGDNDSGMFSDIDGHIRFTSNSQLRMSIYPSGAYVHSGGLVVDGSASFNGGSTELNSWGIRTRREGDASRYVDWARFLNSFSFWMYGGNAHNSGTREVRYDGDSNWDFHSDRRLKKDIVDAESMLERVLEVQIRRYRWKEEDSTGKHKLGVIAQEVQELFPDLVSEGESRDGSEKLLSVGYSDFGMIAIKAIQELHAKHEAEKAAMESELATLKAQMAEVRAQMKEVLQASQELRGQLDRAKATASVGR